MEAFLAAQENGFLSLCGPEGPYTVPITYAYVDQKIIMHCGKEGLKVDLARADSRACFAVALYPQPLRPHEGKCHFPFMSVLCFGKIRELTDLPERHYWLERFRAHLYQRLGLPPKLVTEAEAKGINCLLIDVERMTGRDKIEPADYVDHPTRAQQRDPAKM
jgi:nitroimidazol reductase NimA-like FMN-containing flavoprotein (pyridoxamine 5'-phosphate oxidase superfamily)